MDTLFSWLLNLVNDFGNAFGWLTTDFVTLNGVSLSPLMLIGFGGLSIFLAVAIIKWVIS